MYVPIKKTHKNTIQIKINIQESTKKTNKYANETTYNTYSLKWSVWNALDQHNSQLGLGFRIIETIQCLEIGT